MQTGQQDHIGLDEFKKNMNRIISFIHQSLNYIEEIGLPHTCEVLVSLEKDFSELKNQGIDSERAKFLIMEKFKKQIVESIEKRKGEGLSVKN